MEKFIVTTGKTIDLAVTAALQQLGMDRDSVSVEVLENAKSGFLGIGASPAKVKVTYEVPDEPKKPEAPMSVLSSASRSKPKIEKFLTGLLTHMNSTAVPHAYRTEEGSYRAELVGGDVGMLIGRRGETLDAIQYLTSYAINRDNETRVRVSVDAGDYRLKREEALQHLAAKMAGKAVKYHRNFTLEPMNAYERHVIHAALQDYPEVTTFSTGSEPHRRIVVAYAKEK